MAEEVVAEPERRKGKLPAWMVSKGGLAAIAGGTLLLACCGAYAALRSDGGDTPAVAEEKAEIPVPMPVASKPQALKADAYSIVSVFDGEAFLATPNDLVRVVVGAVVPGLGTITSVEAFPNGGGTVAGTEAVLRTR